jgi:hypothetical protein
MLKDIVFKVARWFVGLINLSFISIFSILVIIFLTELFTSLPISDKAKNYDTVSISNTFIVYVTFIVVICTIALTLAGFYFQKSIAKREGEILNDNMDKVLQAITTDKDMFREKLVKALLEHEKIKPLIQKELDTRVQSFEKDLNNQKQSITEIKESVYSLGEGFNNLITSPKEEIKSGLFSTSIPNILIISSTSIGSFNLYPEFFKISIKDFAFNLLPFNLV